MAHHVAAGLPVLAVAPAREESMRRVAAGAAGRWRRPVRVLGIDGAEGPTRPDRARVPQAGARRARAKRARWRGPWRDAPGLRCALLAGARLVHGRSGHQGHNAAQRGEALKQIKEAGVRPEAQVRLGVVCDGAAWIGKHVQALWPHARQVLDASHGAPALQRGAHAHDGASVQAGEWVAATRSRLSLGQVGCVLGGVRRLQAQSDEAATAMAHGWDSLNAPRGRSNDRQCRRGGYP